jgi:glycosyltransferase involved in cell wall biosynthesis
MKQRVLVYSPYIGIPPVGGPELYIANTLKAVTTNYEVHLFVGSSPLNPHLSDQLVENIGVHSVLFFTRKFGNNRYIAKLQRLIEVFGFSFHRSREASQIAALAESVEADVLWFIFGNTSFQLIKSTRRLSKNIPIVLDTDSIWSDFVLRSIPYVEWFRKPAVFFNGKLRLFQEQKYLDFVDSVTAVSEIDRNKYENIMDTKSLVSVKRNVIDIKDYQYQHISVNDSTATYICITGTFGHRSSSMDLSTKWFVNEVWPLIRQKHQAVWLFIVGKNACFNWFNDDENQIKVFSDVASTSPFLAGSSAVIVPLLFESGTRFKILEAGAFSKPVVSTSLGAEGLDVFHAQHLYIADSPFEFSECVSRACFSGESFDLASNLHHFVERHYSINAITHQIDEAITNALLRNLR